MDRTCLCPKGTRFTSPVPVTALPSAACCAWAGLLRDPGVDPGRRCTRLVPSCPTAPRAHGQPARRRAVFRLLSLAPRPGSDDSKSG